jgi:hypothetical protein
MPKIQVLQPFVLRDGERRIVFDVGTHDVTDAELSHWFVQACIADGRAVPLGEGESAGTDETIPPTGEADSTPAPAETAGKPVKGKKK